MAFFVTTLEVQGLLTALSDKLQWAPVLRCIMSSITPIDLYKCVQDVTNLDRIHIGLMGAQVAGTGDGLVRLYYDTTLKATVTVPQAAGGGTYYGTYDCSGDVGNQIIKLTQTAGQATKAFSLDWCALWAVES